MSDTNDLSLLQASLEEEVAKFATTTQSTTWAEERMLCFRVVSEGSYFPKNKLNYFSVNS